MGGFNAERQFRGTPELVEKLLPFLDLESIKQLAKSHKLTQQILGNSFIWNQLIKSMRIQTDLSLEWIFCTKFCALCPSDFL